MTTAAIAYGVGVLVCWRLVTLSLVGGAERIDGLDDYWPICLFLGALLAVVWPLVLLFWRRDPMHR